MDANIYQHIDGSAFRFGIVRARFNEKITQGMLDRCVETLKAAGVQEKNIAVVEVPGSIETTYALDALARSGRYDALIALGAIIKGATPHFDYISKSVSDGIREVTLAHHLPVVAGVITCLTAEQAVERSCAGALNRGLEAAHVALEMARMRSQQGWK